MKNIESVIGIDPYKRTYINMEKQSGKLSFVRVKENDGSPIEVYEIKVNKGAKGRIRK